MFLQIKRDLFVSNHESELEREGEYFLLVLDQFLVDDYSRWLCSLVGLPE